MPELYGYPADHDGVWLRANFIASLDGGATFGGKTGQLGGPGDRAVFNVLRELADVILVGAGTVRVEGYSGARLTVAQRQRRQARGQSEVPQLAIVTKIRSPGPGYAGVHPHRGATAGAAPARRRPTRPGARWPASPRWSTARATIPAQVDEAAVLAVLAERGAAAAS